MGRIILGVALASAVWVSALVIAGQASRQGSAPLPAVSHDAGFWDAVHAEVRRVGDWSDYGCAMAEARVRLAWYGPNLEGGAQ